VRFMGTPSTPSNRQRARLTRQGQITVPKAIRDALGARPGDDIEFVRRGTEVLVELQPRRSVLEFAGIAAATATRVPDSAKELDALIEGGMADAAVKRAASAGRGSGRSA
jgi:AbrB family looped-hinge helix DNA binding protein